MKRQWTGLLLLGMLAACSHKEEAGDARHASSPMSVEDSNGKTTAPAVRRTLAYRHSLVVDVPEDKVVPVFEAGQAACRALVAEQCTILNARVTGPASGQARGREEASATLTMRALPPAIPKLRATFASKGDLTQQSTSAEELAGPLEDVAKKIALLKDYRDKLEGLRARAANDIDSLIKVNHELAEVQGELEAVTGSQATLQRRVDTELLEVTIGAEMHQTFWRPIGQSASQFGASLSQGTALAISGVAWMLPWAVLLSFVVWIGRKLWRRRK